MHERLLPLLAKEGIKGVVDHTSGERMAISHTSGERMAVLTQVATPKLRLHQIKNSTTS